MELPKNLRYAEYVWAKVEGELATLGVTDYALRTTKEIVFIQLPEKGRINKGGRLASLESVKWSGHIESPLSGEVVEVNEALFDDPEALNRDPYGSWICKLRVSNTKEIDDMMDSKDASEWVKKNM